MDAKEKSAYYSHSLMVAVAGALWGGVLVWANFWASKGFSLFEISLIVLPVISLIFLPALILKKELRIQAKDLKFYAIYGLIGAALQIGQYGGIILGLPVAIAVMLMYTQPIWSTIFGKVMLKETITKGKIIAVAIAIVGILILVDPFSGLLTSNPFGIGAGLLAGISLSLWNIYGRKSRIAGHHYITAGFGFVTFTAIALVVLYPILYALMPATNFTGFQFGHIAEYWPLIIAWAITAGTLPNLLYFKGMGKIPASNAGVLLLTEPVSAALLAAVLFSQPLTTNILVGGAIVLLANYVIIRWGQ